MRQRSQVTRAIYSTSSAMNDLCPNPLRLLDDDGPALLAQELLDKIRAQPAFTRAAAALPTAERLASRPSAGRCPAAPVGIDHTGLDGVEKVLNLRFVLGENAGCQPVFGIVGVLDCL